MATSFTITSTFDRSHNSYATYPTGMRWLHETEGVEMPDYATAHEFVQQMLKETGIVLSYGDMQLINSDGETIRIEEVAEGAGLAAHYAEMDADPAMQAYRAQEYNDFTDSF